MATAEITVRGAGVFGLSIAYLCARRGARVQVIDPGGVGAGASGGILGALAPHTPENWNDKKAFQFESLIAAEAFWAEIETISGRQTGYGRLGRLQPVPDDRALSLAQARATQAADLWQGRARWEVVDAAALGDWAPPSPTGWLIHDTLSARLHPRRAVQALAAAITALGGTIATEGPARGPTVWATGHAGLLALSQALERPIGNGVKGQAALLRHAAPERPQLFAEALHLVPHDDGTVAVGSTSERDFGNPDVTDAQLDALIDRARQLFPVIAAAPVLARWAGVRPRARTRAPILGPHPTRPGDFIANGGFKIGFGMAPKVARVMADLVLEGKDEIPADFRVETAL